MCVPDSHELQTHTYTHTYTQTQHTQTDTHNTHTQTHTHTLYTMMKWAYCMRVTSNFRKVKIAIRRRRKWRGIDTHTHTHTHTHTCLERRGGTIRASLNFLRISEVFVIHRVARSQDYRNQRICAISRSAANGKYRTEKKRDGTQTSVTPESRPFQGNSTRNFCWCTPVHVLNHTSEEITIFAPKSFGQLNMRCCTILHGLTLFLRPRTSSLLTEDVLASNKDHGTKV